MPYDFIPFKNLSFPQGAYQNGSAMVVYNLAPVEGYGYVEFGAVGDAEVLSATQLDTACRGATTFRVGSADYMFLGTTAKLYRLTVASGTLTDLSGAAYATASTDWGWTFTRWGNGVAATNFVDNVQFKADITGAAAFGTCFTSTLVPKAKFMGLVKNQLMIAYTNETGTTYPQRVRWGAVDNIFDMDFSTTTMADYQDLLDDYGEITGFVGGEFGLVFKERCIYKATFVGPPLIYRFDMIASGIGTRNPGSIVEYKGAVYFWGANAIYRVNPGGAGVERVPEGIFKQLIVGDPFQFPSGPWPRAIKYDKTKPYLVHSAVDLSIGCIYWAFPDSGTGATFVVAACVEDGRTAVADCMKSGTQSLQWLVPGTYTGTEFTGAAPGGSSSAAFPRVAYGVNNNKRVSTHRNAPQFPGRIVSGIFSPQLGKRAVITGVRPAFFCAGDVTGTGPLTPVADVKVLEIDFNGDVVAGGTNDFTLGSGGWWWGKANGSYLAIRTTFSTGLGGIPLSFISVAAGWEVIFDEMDDER